jgi:hypothetical protein
MNSHSDIVEYAQQLQDAGVPKAQADVHAHMLARLADTCMVRPADLLALEKRLDTRSDASEAKTAFRFDTVDTKFDAVDARFDAMDTRFDAMDTRFDAMDARFDNVETRLDAMDGRFNAMDARFDAVDAKFKASDEKMDLKLGILETRLEGKIRVLSWMFGACFPLLVAIFVKLYAP